MSEPDLPPMLTAKDVAVLMEWYKGGKPDLKRATKWMVRLDEKEPGCVIRHPTSNHRVLVWREFARRYPEYWEHLAHDS